MQSVQGQTETEVAATRAAWPQIAGGLAPRAGLYTAPVRAAIEAAEDLQLPAGLSERQSAALTGPASSIAGLYRGYVLLAGKGWRLIGGAIYEIEHGTPQASRFARANVALYIDSVYDAHFGLAQIGKKLTAAYTKLGGPEAFGGTLSPGEANALALAFSEPRDRLVPHDEVTFGS